LIDRPFTTSFHRGREAPDCGDRNGIIRKSAGSVCGIFDDLVRTIVIPVQFIILLRDF